MTIDMDRLSRLLERTAESLRSYAHLFQEVEGSLKHLNERIQTTQTVQMLLISLIANRSPLLRTDILSGLAAMLEKPDILNPEMDRYVRDLLQLLDPAPEMQQAESGTPAFNVIQGGRTGRSDAPSDT